MPGLRYLHHHEIVNPLVPESDNALLSLDDSEEVPLAWNDVNLSYTVQFEKIVHYLTFVARCHFDQDEGFLFSPR